MSVKAVALLSGGLDSTLAVLLALRQNIAVQAITFLTDFGCEASDTSSCSRSAAPAAARFGFDLKLAHLGEKFVDIVKRPRHGHGRNMNPCIDCRILMLREAKTLMEMTGADFVITGEVLGQRPMSQRRDTLDLIARESGLKGILLRPLSARLLPPTIPESKGMIDRKQLQAISGRSRKVQMALAREFGLTDYPTPAGGCLLTDPIYSRRLKDLLRAAPDPCSDDLRLLRIGRHFRPSKDCKVVVGRNEQENAVMETLRRPEDILLQVRDAGSPLVLVRGNEAGNYIAFGAALCARYSDLKHSPAVSVSVMDAGGEQVVTTAPAGQDAIDRHRIE
jgi:tRNA U34 2-thiouridine synthase MnmA/TrmU